METGLYRGAAISYEVFVYNHWEVFRNKVIFFKPLPYNKAIENARSYHNQLIHQFYNSGLITNANSLKDSDIHLYKGKMNHPFKHSKETYAVMRKGKRRFFIKKVDDNDE